MKPSNTNEAAAATTHWFAAALVVLPFLQALPLDFDRTAPLLLLPVIWFGRAELPKAIEDAWDAPRWRRGVMLLALLATAAAVILADHRAPALVTAASWVLLVAAALIAGRTVTGNSEAGWRLLAAIALSVAAGTVVVWALWVWGGRGMMPLYAHHRHLGLHAIAGSVGATALITRAGTTRAARWRWFACGAITWAGLLWSGGRGPVLALAGGLIAWCLVDAGARRRVAAWSTGQFFAGLALSAVFWTPSAELGWWHAFQRTVVASESRSIAELTSTRNEFWRDAMHHAAATPWLGRGPDAYRFLLPKLDGQQPHNVVLQLWLDLGLLGAVPVLILLGTALVCGWKTAGRRPDAVTAPWAAILTALTLAAMLDGAFYHVLTLISALLAAGIVLRRGEGAANLASTMLTRPLAGGAVGAAVAILALHAFLFHILAVAPPPPQPTGFAPLLVRAFPSTTFGLWNWLDEWYRTRPDDALAWARWAEAHSPNPALFHVRAAQYLAVRGDLPAARAELRAALAKVHWTVRPQIAAMLREMGGAP